VVGLVASLVLTTKASDDPTYDGQAAVHGHPKVAAGSGRQKPISETPLMSSEADSEEHTMPLVMTEDNAMMLSEEVNDDLISIHEFKEVLHEIIKDAVDKIVLKKAGIVGKLKTAKQSLVGHHGEVIGREFQAMDTCLCDARKFDRRGRGDCNSKSREFNGRQWCFLETFSFCHDGVASNQFPGRFWSHFACT